MNFKFTDHNGKIHTAKIENIRVTHNEEEYSVSLAGIKSFKEIESEILSIISEPQENHSINNEIDSNLKKINTIGKRFNKAINQKTEKIVETEKALREANLFIATKIIIPDGNTIRPAKRFLAWRSTGRDKPYRIIFIGPEPDKNDEFMFHSKPFTETPLKVRLKYVKYLPLLVTEVLKEAEKIVGNID